MDPVRMACVTRSSSTSLGYRKTPSSGYEDEVGLLAVTFDPDRDTADALRAYSTERGIDPPRDTGITSARDNETAQDGSQ